MRSDSQESKLRLFACVFSVCFGLFLQRAAGEEQASHSALCEDYCQDYAARLQLIPLENNRQNVEVEMCYCNADLTQAPRMASVYVQYNPDVLSFNDVQPLDALSALNVDLRYRIIQSSNKTYLRLMAINKTDDRRMGKGAWLSLKFERLRQDTTQVQFSTQETHRTQAFAPAEAQALMNAPGSWGGPVALTIPGEKEMVLYYSFNAGDARDSSGNNRHGLLWGGKSIAGMFSQALRFDGIRDRLILPAWYYENSTFDFSTVSFWFYSEPGHGLPTVLAEHLDTAKTPRLIIQLEDNAAGQLDLTYIRGSMGVNGDTAFESPRRIAEVSPLQWYQLTYEVDNQQVHFFLDGEYRGSFAHGIGKLPFCPARNPDTKKPVYGERDSDEWVVFSSQGVGSSDIMRMSPLGEFRTNLTDTEGMDEREPAWNSQRKKIAFVAQDPSGQTDLHWMNLDGSQVQALTEGLTKVGHPSWSPDGTQLVFHSEVDGDFDIYLLDKVRLDQPVPTLKASDLDDPRISAKVHLTNNSEIEDRNPVFVGNTRLLYESVDDRGSKRIAEYDIRNKISSLLPVPDAGDNTSEKRPEVYYKIEANGTTTIKILFERARINQQGQVRKNAYIYDCSVAGDQDSELCSNAPAPLPVFPSADDISESDWYSRTHFKWSADGTEIIYVSYENSLAEIYRVRADGSGQGQMRLSLGGANDLWPQWIRQERDPVCHQVSGLGDTQGSYFAGGIDELQVWNYLREPELVRLDYLQGQERMLRDDFVPPEPMARSCPNGLHSECPIYYLCQEDEATAACGPDQPCPEESVCVADPSTGRRHCVRRQCVMQECRSQQDCALGTCIEHPGLRRQFCRVDCSFDAQCYGTLCPMGGPCSICQAGRCGECRTADDCPDNNAYRCDAQSNTCKSDCYASVDGAWQYLCMDFETCHLGRCEMYNFTMNDFQPATQKSLTSATQIDIVIQAAGVSDYLIQPRMVLEGKPTNGSSWIHLASWYVRNRPTLTHIYEKYKTGTRIPLERLRIRMEPEPMDVVNSGSLREMGYLVDLFQQYVPPNAVGISVGKQALFIKDVSVGTAVFDSTKSDLVLWACKSKAGYIDDNESFKVESELVSDDELIPINCSNKDVRLDIVLPHQPVVPAIDDSDNPGKFELIAPIHCDPLQEGTPYRLQVLQIDSIVSY